MCCNKFAVQSDLSYVLPSGSRVAHVIPGTMCAFCSLMSTFITIASRPLSVRNNRHFLRELEENVCSLLKGRKLEHSLVGSKCAQRMFTTSRWIASRYAQCSSPTWSVNKGSNRRIKCEKCLIWLLCPLSPPAAQLSYWLQFHIFIHFRPCLWEWRSLVQYIFLGIQLQSNHIYIFSSTKSWK